MNIRIKEKWIKIVIADDFRARVGNEGFIFDNKIRPMRVIRLYSVKEQIEIRIGIFREMERTPCYCCGSLGHSVITKARTRSGVVGRKYICPIVEYEDLYPPGNDWVYINFYPCPIKLATKNHYDLEVIQMDLARMDRRGLGMFMSSSEKDQFKEVVTRLCWDFRYGHTFKREIMNTSVFIDGEEDKSTDEDDKC